MTKKKRASQKVRILKYMQTHGAIQPLDALLDEGVYRLSAVIKLLRDDGHNIITKRMNVKNSFGESRTYAEYRLVKNVAETYSEAA